MISQKLLTTFATIIEQGSFEKAAQHLHITQSAVSQRLKQLEDQLGDLLVIRSLPVVATEKGAVLLRYYQQLQLLNNDLRNILSQSHQEEKPVISIGVNADSLATWFIPKISQFLKSNDYLLDIKIADQSITVNELLAKGKVMACISEQLKAVASCNVKYLMDMTYICVATPTFIKDFFPKGATADALINAPTVFYNRDDKLHERMFGHALQSKIKNDAQLAISYVPSSESYVEYILQGLAYGIVPKQQIKDQLNAGELCELPVKRQSTQIRTQLNLKLYWHYWHASKVMDTIYQTLVR